MKVADGPLKLIKIPADWRREARFPNFLPQKPSFPAGFAGKKALDLVGAVMLNQG
jgi:hypothetical protein